MPPTTLTTQQVADAVGVPYTTLLKWQTTDRLLQPVLGPGGRRGGDRWTQAEVELARLVVRLRGIAMPVRLIRAVTDTLRSRRGRWAEVSVYLAVHVRDGTQRHDQRVALIQLGADGPQLETIPLARPR